MAAHQSRAPDPDAIDLGSVVEGRYEITERLGAGGFATVFKAQDLQAPRALALKVLHADPRVRNDPAFRARFEREARLAARIEHPNVVAILGHGLAGPLEQPFIAMEFLEGYDLAFMLEQEGRFDARRALRLLVPCLEALGRGHAQGIVHKDLKPGNLFVTHPGTDAEVMKVLDFGIASREAPGERRITRAGELLGTPEYLAPEYIDRAIVSPALDVYQMGLILGEMLVGHPLARADSAIGSIILHSQGVPIPHQLAHNPLRPVLEGALARDVARRYPDAEAFRRALLTLDPEAVEHALQHDERRNSGAVVRPDTVPSNIFDSIDPRQLELLMQTAHGLDDVASEEMAALDEPHPLDLGLATTVGAEEGLTAIGWQQSQDGSRERHRTPRSPAPAPAPPSAANAARQTLPRSPALPPLEQHFAATRPHISAYQGPPARQDPTGGVSRTVLLVAAAIFLALLLLLAVALLAP